MPDLPSIEFPPFDADTGPFSSRDFIEVWWSHFGRGSLETVRESDGEAVLWHGPDSVLRFAGESHLTDYHTLRGVGGAQAVADLVAARPATAFVFDSLPEAGVDAVESALNARGVATHRRVHEVCLRLFLPNSYEDYLAALGKKQRHEVRRKVKRLTERFGSVEVTSGRPRDFGDFTVMHRGSRGAKGDFMDDVHEAFFRDLLRIGARVDVLRSSEAEPLAALFGFYEADAYYLYNSAYDTSLQSLSPGIVLIAALIRRLTADGYRLLDFLKGDEGYKLRLGAQPRPLFELTGET
jgi:CelD/BcsL family acetyltransferase involved in cellulose biosynthesis